MTGAKKPGKGDAGAADPLLAGEQFYHLVGHLMGKPASVFYDGIVFAGDEPGTGEVVEAEIYQGFVLLAPQVTAD